MYGMNRDTEEIALFCKKFRAFCEEISREANDLKLIASTVDGVLKDDIGQKAVQRVEEFADEIMAIVYQGEQPILELEKRNNALMERLNEVKGLIR